MRRVFTLPGAGYLVKRMMCSACDLFAPVGVSFESGASARYRRTAIIPFRSHFTPGVSLVRLKASAACRIASDAVG